MAGQLARREAGAMPLRIVTDEATPPDALPRPCPRGLRRLSPAAASRRSGQYRRGYSHFACSLHQTKIIRNATPSDFGIGSKVSALRLSLCLLVSLSISLPQSQPPATSHQPLDRFRLQLLPPAISTAFRLKFAKAVCLWAICGSASLRLKFGRSGDLSTASPPVQASALV
jgi:hypothetical protein